MTKTAALLRFNYVLYVYYGLKVDGGVVGRVEQVVSSKYEEMEWPESRE